jgi:hypothetical protein
MMCDGCVPNGRLPNVLKFASHYRSLLFESLECRRVKVAVSSFGP